MKELYSFNVYTGPHDKLRFEINDNEKKQSASIILERGQVELVITQLIMWLITQETPDVERARAH